MARGLNLGGRVACGEDARMLRERKLPRKEFIESFARDLAVLIGNLNRAS